jgi:hypothetical protein
VMITWIKSSLQWPIPIKKGSMACHEAST